MTYFGDEKFALIAAIFCLGGLVIRWRQWPIKYWLALGSLIIYAGVFGADFQHLLVSLVFLAFQYGLIQYQFRHPEFKWTVYLSFLPLVLAKLHEIWPIYSFGFVGISYLSFKVVQILLETQDGLIKEMSLVDYLSFLLFFPVVSAGPIDRSKRFVADTEKILDWKDYWELLGLGSYRLLLGAVYKFVIAAVIFKWLSALQVGNYFYYLIKYAYGYTFYLFFDFAGYSLMAVGLSNLLGIETPMNFKQPFLAIDIKDFWNRWHITLSTWLRDFVFSRIVMRFMRKKIFKKRLTTAMVAYMINMTFMGFWHGITLNYIAYGFYHGILMAAFEWYQKKSKFYKKNKNKTWYKVISWIITMHLVMFGFLIFSGKMSEWARKLI